MINDTEFDISLYSLNIQRRGYHTWLERKFGQTKGKQSKMKRTAGTGRGIFKRAQ